MRGFGRVIRRADPQKPCFEAAFLHFSLLSSKNRETEPFAIRAETASWLWLDSCLETACNGALETDWALKARQSGGVRAHP